MPLSCLLLIVYASLQLLPLYLSSAFSLYSSFIMAIVAIVSGIYLLDRYTYLSYGVVLGGFCMFYMTCYKTYLVVDMLKPQDLVVCVTVVNLWALLVAMRLRGRLLAMLSVIVASVLPSLFLGTFFTKQLLALYFILLLAIVMIFSYITNWLFLNILAVLGYLVYNPLLFQSTSIEPIEGSLTLYESLWIMGLLFYIYTAIPLLYTIFTKKQRLFESLSITLVGAYTFAMSRFLIANHLLWVKELPFFMKIFIRDVPTMGNVHMQMFFIYTSVYAALFCVLLLISRRSTVVLATLANLACMSLFGLLYVHSFTVELVNYLVWLHDLLIGVVV